MKIALNAAALFTMCAMMGIALYLAGCPQAVAAAPSAVASVSCVTEDALAGKSISQIVLDCGGDVAQVIAILEDSKDSKVSSSKAHAEADKAFVVFVKDALK